MGTANDLARTLGIPEDLEAAADVILAGHRRRIDLGTVNGKPFFNVASIGLSAELARELSPRAEAALGPARLRAGGAPGAGARPPLRGLDHRGRRRRRAPAPCRSRSATAASTAAARWSRSDAAIDDGHLDLYSLEMRTVWKLALMLRSFRSGEHGAWSEVRTARGTEFEIRTRRPRPVNADGELIAETPAVFKVHPGAVTVLRRPRRPAAAPG